MSLTEARQIIRKAIKSKSQTIDLSSQSLGELPVELLELKNISRLNISYNQLVNLPDWLLEFKNLKFLDVRNNRLAELPKSFLRFQCLEMINLRDNNLKTIPIVLKDIKSLKFVSVSNNNIERIPSWFFEIADVAIENNPVIDPPIEVYFRGNETIKNYFNERALGTENLYEAKLLIVGEPGAGKTTLMHKMLDSNYVLNPEEISTKGIEIQPYNFKTIDGNQFRINIWDFGGQEIYHATHQFFLTKRSLYVLLSDNREENTDFNYWLQTIELLSNRSPTIIVQNEKQDRKKDINISGMKERFSNLISNFSFNLGTDSKMLTRLKREIEHQIYQLPHIGTELPSIWVEIRKALEEKAITVPYITDADYFSICKKNGMLEIVRMYFLSSYLHDLGVFLHFQDNPILKRWIILRPDWATEAVYKILDSDKVIESNGYFTRLDLKDIWDDSKYAEMHDELTTLMMKFELCYQIDGSDAFIAPQLLRKAKPNYKWDGNNNIVLKYDYEFMPKGIITRFIVRMYYLITDQNLVWREGVILERQGSRAEVLETYGKREIRIRISGTYKTELLGIIMDCMDKIHLTYHNLRIQKLIPCNCEDCNGNKEPFYFSFDRIRNYISKNIYEDRCAHSLKMIKLISLQNSILGGASSGSLKVFISFTDDDSEYFKEFIKHFRVLERTIRMSVDSVENISSGENWKEFVRNKIDTSDIIIALISSDYLSSDWHSTMEMQKAIDRMDTDSCLFIPVIIRDCIWRGLPVANIKPVLYKTKPLFIDGVNVDSALVDATNQIKYAIDNFKKNKAIHK
ncbi:MAG: TIR domain-containing protein [Bacteroidetes bacterium]|nr:TIR domain-containing protein [Bacteroidota bacterium]